MNTESYKYGRHINFSDEARWATDDEIKSAAKRIQLDDESYSAAGIPLMATTKEAYVDNKDTHTLIFGATGSKKTRLFCMPLINILAKGGESFVVTDPKGELYSKTAGLAKAKGYRTVVLNFRDIGKGDMWNPLSLPYDIYKSGNKDKALSMLNDFISAISAPHSEKTKDIFWIEMASSFALANLLLLIEAGTKEEMNVASLARLCNMDQEKVLAELMKKMDSTSLAAMNYSSIFSAAENTKRSIYVSLYAMVRIFTIQENLMKMLSGNTVDLKNIGREKTAVYLIVPDEKCTYHFLTTVFIKQAYEVLVEEAQKEEDKKLPVRVNFVLDEFCNMPKVQDMPAMISAARSRNIRYFLVAQSLHQLRNKYGEEADTIKGNCDNWVFLTSKELDLLNEISELCGSFTTADKVKRRLISISELQRLDKERGEALIMHSRQYPYITQLPDIDDYDCFKGYKAEDLDKYEMPDLKMFSPADLLRDAKNGLREYPFANKATVDAEIDYDSILKKLFESVE